MSYEDRMQSRGEAYINGLRAAPFYFNGDEYAFFFYEINRVSWCIAADMEQIEVWTADAQPRILSLNDARAWLECAARKMTGRARVFHEGSDS